MLLSTPAVRLARGPAELQHDLHAPQAAVVPTKAASASTSGGAAASIAALSSSSAAQLTNASPARRVLRALLTVTKQRSRQAGPSSSGRVGGGGSSKQHPRQDARVDAPPPAPPPTAAPTSLLLHSAASLPPPSPPETSSRLQQYQEQQQQHVPPLALGAPSEIDEGDAPAATAASHPTRRRHHHRNGPLRRLLRTLLHHSHRAAHHARPQGPGCNDVTRAERLVNVLTSIPFFLVGAHVLRTRRAPAARRFGRSFLAVGAVAAAYHACPRESRMRDALRKADYYAIAWSSCALREAVGLKAPPLLMAAACAVTPAKPTLVTGANLVAIEMSYARAALRQGAPAHVREAWRRHMLTAGAGVCCFLAEDTVVAAGGLGGGAGPLGGFNALHGAWHLLSAAALGLVTALLGHVEQALLLEAAEVVVVDGDV